MNFELLHPADQLVMIMARIYQYGMTTTSGTFINNPGSVYSEPVITVYGSGEITLMVGMVIVELDGITDSITLDAPLMEAYKDTTGMNGCMSGDFPTLLPGQNAISWTGNVTKVVVQPNWRYLV